jgi:transcriptional regulator with XRE-family HTH domain
MRKEKASFDVLNKIQIERQKRGWTEYALAKNSELSQSTISSWYRKDLEPSLASIEHICNGLGITLSQFFSNEEYKSNLSIEQTVLMEKWEKLSPDQRKALISLLESFDNN